MWRRGRTSDQEGGLELAQASATNYVMLFDFRTDAIKTEIRDKLESGPQPVSFFYIELPERSDNVYCEPAYRPVLLEMEAAGEIEVLTKDGTRVISAEKRRKYKGGPSLGKDYLVRLKRN